MGKTLVIYDKPVEEQQQYDLIVYWSSFQECENAYSIPRLIENESEFLKAQYLKWLYEFGQSQVNGKSIIEHLSTRNNFSFWWMSLLVEKSLWKSPGIYDAFRLMALELVLQQHDINRVDIGVNNKNVQKSISQWCNDNGVVCNKLGIPKKTQELAINILPYTLQALNTFIRYFVKHWPLRQNKKTIQSRFTDSGITFISYFFNLDKKSADEGKFYTRFWTSLHDLLSTKKINTSWLHLYIKNDISPTTGKAKILANKFNSIIQSHIFLDSSIGWKVFKDVVFDYFKLLFAGLRLRKIHLHFKFSSNSINLWYVLRNDWKCSLYGSTAITNCLYLNLFEDIFKQIPKQRKGFYLLENHAWERSLIYAWKNSGHGELIGVPHTIISYWDLRHFFSPEEYIVKNGLKLPLPDKVALNGQAAIKLYNHGGFPVEHTVSVEALRYIYLGKLKTDPKLLNKTKMVRLLVLGDYRFDITTKQMKLLSAVASNLPDDVEIIVKSHPACPIDVLKWPNLNMKVVHNSMEELIEQYDIAYTSNPTGAAVDAYLSGKRVLTMLDPDAFNLSPLRGFLGIEFVSTPKELLEKLSVKQHNYKFEQDFFFMDADLPRWKELLINKSV